MSKENGKSRETEDLRIVKLQTLVFFFETP
jgi:hypothetical protein